MMGNFWVLQLLEDGKIQSIWHFLAVNLNIRNSGVGAQILNALTNKFADAIVVAEIENPYENCCDDEKRAS